VLFSTDEQESESRKKQEGIKKIFFMSRVFSEKIRESNLDDEPEPEL